MAQNPSREHEPTSLGWIFGGVLGLLVAGSGLVARRLRRRDARREVVVEELPLPPTAAPERHRRDS